MSQPHSRQPSDDDGEISLTSSISNFFSSSKPSNPPPAMQPRGPSPSQVVKMNSGNNGNGPTRSGVAPPVAANGQQTRPTQGRPAGPPNGAPIAAGQRPAPGQTIGASQPRPQQPPNGTPQRPTQQQASALNPAISRPGMSTPQQPPRPNGNGAPPSAIAKPVLSSPSLNPSPDVLPSDLASGGGSPLSDAGSSSGSSAATNAAIEDLRSQLDRLTQEYRLYKRTTQEELETAKRTRISLQNQLKEAQTNQQEAEHKLNETTIRCTELQTQLQKSRVAAESELNFFNLEVEKEIARSKQDKEKLKLQQTLASYEDAHGKNKKIIETLNNEIMKLKTAYKAVLNGGAAGVNTTGGLKQSQSSNSIQSLANGTKTAATPVAASTPGTLAVTITPPVSTSYTSAIAPNTDPNTQLQLARAEIDRLTLELARVREGDNGAAPGSSSSSSSSSIASLQSQLASLEAQSAAQIAELRLRAEQAETRVQVEGYNTGASSSSNDEVQALKAERDEAVANLTALQTKLASLQSELTTSSSTISDLETRLSSSETQRQNAVLELNLLRESSGVSSAEEDERMVRINELSEQVASMQASQATLQKELRDMTLKRDELESKLTAAETKLTASEKQLSDQRQSFTLSQDAHKQLSNEYAALDARRRSLEDEMKVLNDKLSTTSTELTTTKSSLLTIQTSLNDLQEQHSTSIVLHEQQLKKSWTQIASLQSEIESAKTQAEAESKAAQKREAVLREEGAKEKERGDKLQKQLTTLKTDTDLTNAAHIEARRAIENKLTQAITQHTTETQTLQNALQAEKQQLLKTKEEHTKEIAELNARLQKLHSELEVSKSTHATYVQESNTKQAQLRDEMTKEQAAHTQTRAELQALTTRTTADAEHAQETIHTLEQRITDLQIALQDKRTALQAYHDQIEWNAQKKKEKMEQQAAQAKAEKEKKSSLLGSLAKKLHLENDKKPSSSSALDTSTLDVDMFSHGAEQAERQDELAEEVAISLTRRLQESENARVALEAELTRLKQNMRPSGGINATAPPGSRPSTANTRR